MKIKVSSKSFLLLIAFLFFLSGISGLIYQTVWVRLLEIFFGVTQTAITLIVSAYMAGLGVGTLLGGRLADRFKNSRNNLDAFGFAQLVIGCFGILSPEIIGWIGKSTAGISYTFVFLISFLLLIIPTMFMGMTLPFLVQAFNLDVRNSGKTIGLLYGINTLGAAFGALATGFLIIGWVGFKGALFAAFAINIFVGIAAIFLNHNRSKDPELGEPAGPAKADEAGSSLNFGFSLSSAFLVGFIGMGFEMLWIRFLGIISKSTAYTFPGILFVYLLAFGIGGWLFGKKADSSKDPTKLFWQLQLGIGILTAMVFIILWRLINLPDFLPVLRSNFNNIQQANPLPAYVTTLKDGITETLVFSKKEFLAEITKFFIPIIVMVFPGAFLMGGSLPILDRIAIESARESGRRVGDVHLSNIIGSVFGTLAISFLFLPLFGSELTQKILSLLTLSFFVFFLFQKKNSFRIRYLVLPALLITLVLLLPGKGEIYTLFYRSITRNQDVKINESGDALLAITFNDDSHEPAGLWIGGIQNSYFPSTGEYERSALTCAAAVRPKNILIIGFGGGNTSKFFATLPDVENIVIVELAKDLGHFLSENVGFVDTLLSDPRVEYIIDDGRRFLYANPDDQYDLIFIDPMWSYQAGHNNLYSEEAIRLYQSHLAENGVFCSWTNEGHFIPKTIASVFEYSDYFSDFIVSSGSPIHYDMDYMSLAYADFVASMPAELRSNSLKMLEPEAIISGKVSDREKTLINSQNVPLLQDMNPWLEYFFICPSRFIRELNVYQLRYCSQRL